MAAKLGKMAQNPYIEASLRLAIRGDLQRASPAELDTEIYERNA